MGISGGRDEVLKILDDHAQQVFASRCMSVHVAPHEFDGAGWLFSRAIEIFFAVADEAWACNRRQDFRHPEEKSASRDKDSREGERDGI